MLFSLAKSQNTFPFPPTKGIFFRPFYAYDTFFYFESFPNYDFQSCSISFLVEPKPYSPKKNYQVFIFVDLLYSSNNKYRNQEFSRQIKININKRENWKVLFENTVPVIFQITCFSTLFQ